MNIPKDKPQRGQCYKNAHDFVFVNPTWRIAHGIAVLQGGPDKGQPFGHAWALSEGNFAFDPFNSILMPAPLYYQAGEVSHVKIYTLDEANQFIHKHKHYGPWCSRIAAVAHRREA